MLLLIVVSIVSCKDSSNKKKAVYALEKTRDSLSFPLDANTKSFILALFPYTDANGKEYLTFQNQGQNEILFYDMNSGKLDFKVKPAYEGPNGVGEVLGYYVHNLDSIFLTIMGQTEIVLIDRNAIVKDKIQYGKADDGTPLSQFYSVSSTYQPIIFIGNTMYIISGANRWAEKNPVSAVIDLDTKSMHVLPFSYPIFPGADNKAKRAGVEESFSRFFDGEYFVYSFHYKENIYITSPVHDSVRQVKIKSKYIDKVKLLDDYGNLTFKDMCENPNYGNLIFDKYREVYYRIAYPQTEIEKDVKAMELLEYGRKNFSIIILDKDFTVIGETLFPDYTYNSQIMFIRKDGLYICDSHCMNPNFTDEILSFRKFELVKK